MTAFKIVVDDDVNNPSQGHTRVIHKATGKTSLICVETVKGLVEAVLSVHSAHVAKFGNMAPVYVTLAKASFSNKNDMWRDLKIFPRKTKVFVRVTESRNQPKCPEGHSKKHQADFRWTGCIVMLSVQLNVRLLVTQNSLSHYWANTVHTREYSL